MELSMESRTKINKIVQYIRLNGLEDGFDTFDLEDGVSCILAQMEIYTLLTKAEEELLRKELHKLFRMNEVSEISRMVFDELCIRKLY